MSELIPLARPSISDAERSALLRVLDGPMLTGGERLIQFEELLASHCQRREAIAVSSGTSALELALWALELERDEPVLVTAFGFPAAANAVRRMGARPVAVDVREDNWCTDLAEARRVAEEHGDARILISIDQFGWLCEGAEIDAFAADTGLTVLSDAACSLGGLDSAGRPGGKSGRLACFSFHPRKVLTTGEGGAVLTDDEALGARIRSLRNHGQGAGGFERVGTNARLSELAAAMGCAQMGRLEAMLTERRLLARGYEERLAELVSQGRVELQRGEAAAQSARQSFCVLLGEGTRPRSEIIAALAEQEIQSGVGTYSFAELATHSGAGAAPVAKKLHQKSLSLPLYVGMRSAQLDRVCDALAEVI